MSSTELYSREFSPSIEKDKSRKGHAARVQLGAKHLSGHMSMINSLFGCTSFVFLSRSC